MKIDEFCNLDAKNKNSPDVVKIDHDKEKIKHLEQKATHHNVLF